MSTSITAAELAELLVETGHHHHRAYESSDGVDPEWALWYAGYLQTRLFDHTTVLPTRSLLVHLLLQAESDFVATEQAPAWPPVYADFILTELQKLS